MRLLIVLLISLVTIEAYPGNPAICLLRVCELLDIKASLEELSKLSGGDETGTSMYGLWYAAKVKGIECRGVEASLDELKEKMAEAKFAIALIRKGETNRFILIRRINESGVEIIAPNEFAGLMSREEFRRIYVGCALLILGKREKPKNTPDIYFEEISHSFGKVAQNQVISYTFRFRNRGDKPLKIKEVKSSCSCTAALISKDEIRPGEEGQIKVTYNTGYREGRFREEVRVISNDPEKPQIILTISGEVVRSIVALPDGLYLGRIRGERRIEREVRLIDLNGERLEVKKVKSSSKRIKVKVEREKGREDVVKLRIIIDPLKMRVGKLDERVIVHTNNDLKPVIEIPITGELVGEVEVRPSRLFFGMVKPGEEVELKAEVINWGKGDLKLLSVESTSKLVDVKVREVKAGRRYELDVVLHPHDEGAIKGEIRIRTNNPRRREIRLPFYGYCLILEKGGGK